MQHLNDDMDDLIRRAAKDYPLSTGGADWAKVQKALLAEEGAHARKESDNKKYFFLLLLLPLGLICNKYFARHGEDIDQSVIHSSTPVMAGPARVTQTKKADAPVSMPVQKGPVLVQKQLSVNTPNTSAKTTSLKNTGDRIRIQERIPVIQQLTTDARTEDLSLPARPYIALDRIGPLLVSGDINIAQPVGSIDLSHASFKPAKPESAREKRFYIAALGGADATTIKFQKLERLSYHYGALLGYNFYKNWSIEAGVFATKKYYNSKGEYFSTEKITLPPNTIISNVDGSCMMLEFPVNLKYDFNSGRPSKWFAAAGISSYMMKEEDYAYLYYYSNSGTSRKVYRSYENSSDHLAAALNLSAGFTRPLGKFASMRVEPFIGIPLKGAGIGSLPFTSGGIRLGLSKKLF